MRSDDVIVLDNNTLWFPTNEGDNYFMVRPEKSPLVKHASINSNHLPGDVELPKFTLAMKELKKALSVYLVVFGQFKTFENEVHLNRSRLLYMKTFKNFL